MVIYTDVHMGPGKKVIVEAGATLKIKNGKITVDETIGCNNGHFWKVIELIAANLNEDRGYLLIHTSTL